MMVERILDATRELLKKSDDPDAPRLTTNLVAKQAGISIGSLYQYFPNIESILYELYQQIIDQVIQVLDEFDSVARLSLPREEFFNELIGTALKAEADPEVTFAMHKAIKTYPILGQMERKHAENVAEKMASFMKHYGSSWPMEKLRRLALYIYYVNYGTWVYREHIRPSAEESIEWEFDAMNHMLEKCFQ